MTFQVKFQKYVMHDILGFRKIPKFLNQHRVNQGGVAVIEDAERLFVSTTGQVDQLLVAQIGW